MILTTSTTNFERFLRYRHSAHGRVPGIADGIRKYSGIMKLASAGNFSSDFQTIFQEFYQLSFHKPSAVELRCRRMFFKVLEDYYKEKVKDVGTGREIKAFDIKLYERVLKDLNSIAGRYEVSFASKLLHTLYPGYFPIYDSVVGHKHFGIRNNWGGSISRAVSQYEEYNRRFIASLYSPSSVPILEAFDTEFSSELSGCGYPINNLKKADFIMWVDRPKSNPMSIQVIAP